MALRLSPGDSWQRQGGLWGGGLVGGTVLSLLHGAGEDRAGTRSPPPLPPTAMPAPCVVWPEQMRFHDNIA